MTDSKHPGAGPIDPAHRHPPHAVPVAAPGAPEWPRLSRTELRRIVLDVLG